MTATYFDFTFSKYAPTLGERLHRKEMDLWVFWFELYETKPPAAGISERPFRYSDLDRERGRLTSQSFIQVIEQWVPEGECRKCRMTKIPPNGSRTKNHHSQSANSRKQSRPIVSTDPLSARSHTSSTTSQSHPYSTTLRQITSLPFPTLYPTWHGPCTGPYKGVS
ncbi:unnamed protein product [Lactuca saligna]|uniref:Uncharacterized protein n=1 Tax=Lactuca saligna TaxID=75948 RepID=A0AA35Z8G8_LACSI|nr:unnamed protein product [Lactuca saligna]